MKAESGPQAAPVIPDEEDHHHRTAPLPSVGDMAEYWARRGQALCPSDVVRFLQQREDVLGDGRAVDPRAA